MKKSFRLVALFLVLSMAMAMLPLTATAVTIRDMKIVAFGDSLTHYGNSSTGTYDEYGNLIYNNAYPEYLSKLLGADVYNAGVGGNTTDMAVHRMENEVINQNADVVIICLGMNDQAYAVGAKSVLTPIERYRANLETMAKTFQEKGITVIFATPNPVCTETGYYKDGKEYTYNNGQLPLYANAMREVAIKYGCGLVDIYYEFSVLSKMGPYMGYGDGIHQSDAGRQLYAQLVAEYINAIYGSASKAAMKIRCVDKSNRLIKEYSISGATGAEIIVPSPELGGYTAVTADVKTTFVNGAIHTFTYDSDLESLISKAGGINRGDYASLVLSKLDAEVNKGKSLLDASSVDVDDIADCIKAINNLLETKTTGELVLSIGAKYEASDFTYSNKIYADDGLRLTDGAKGAPSGASSLYSAWQSNATVIVDLGEAVESDIFRGYFACTSGWGIKNPTGMTVYYESENGTWVKINGKLEIKKLLDEATNENGTWTVETITVKANSAVKARKIKFEIPRNGGFIWVDEMEVALKVGEASESDPEPENDNLALYKPYTAEGVYVENGVELYPDENGDSLTDGVVADTTAGYDNYAFVGFNQLTDYYKNNGYASVTVDLGKSYDLGKLIVRTSTANESNLGAGVLVPVRIEFYVSANGGSWNKVGETTPVAGSGDTNATLVLDSAVSGRYVQYRIVGDRSWIMISEVEAYKPVATDDDSSNKDDETDPNPDTPNPDTPKPENPDPEQPDVAKGDINGNGEIDSMDYVLLKRAYFGTYKLSNIAIGDINDSGKIDSMDYVFLKRAYFGTYNIK